MTEIKRRRMITFFTVAICFISIFGTMALYMREYRRAPFEYLSAFCETMIEENPEMEQAVLASLKQYYDGLSHVGLREESSNSLAEKSIVSTESHRNQGIQEIQGIQGIQGISRKRFLEQYGYRSETFDAGVPISLTVVSIAAVVMTAGCFLFVWWYPGRYERTRIAELTDYLEQINVGCEGAGLLMKEDEFSHLQDEMHKTVTELYRTREQAVAAKQNYADNLANIAHQLKTPITAALLSLQILERGKTSGIYDADEIERSNEIKPVHINQIKKQLQRLQYLEEALLTLSKIDAGVLELECTAVDVYTVLTLASDNLNNLLTQKNISVSIPEKGSITFQGDMEWTMEALMNLIKNCMEHSPQGTTIHCDYSENLLYTQMRIWDEGTGFAAQDLPHLFERFYRGVTWKEKTDRDNGMSENDTNVGIGLSLARSIFELQNGTITAHNLPQGGACFEIRVYSH